MSDSINNRDWWDDTRMTFLENFFAERIIRTHLRETAFSIIYQIQPQMMYNSQALKLMKCLSNFTEADSDISYHKKTRLSQVV